MKLKLFSKGRLQSSLLSMAGYVTVLAVSIGGVAAMDVRAAYQYLALLFIILFILTLPMREQLQRGMGQAQTHIYLSVQTLLVTGLLLLDTDNHESSFLFSLLFVVVTGTALLTLPIGVASPWLGLASAITLANQILRWGWELGLRNGLPLIGSYLFFGALSAALRRAEIAQADSQRLLQRLRATNAQLEQYAAEVESLAVIEERHRLSREMHDTVGHRLTVSAVQLEAIQRLIPNDPQRAAVLAGTVRQQVREALSELRETVATLRTPVEDETTLPAALSRLVSGFRQATGIIVRINVPQDSQERIGSSLHRLVIYRAAQEALTNIQRHAEARQAWIDLTIDAGRIRLTIHDDGRGFPEGAESLGTGLRGVKERAAQMGGHVRLGTGPAGGAQIEVSLPCGEEPGTGQDPEAEA